MMKIKKYELEQNSRNK